MSTSTRRTQVSRDHTLNRVRENQRRHRARRRDHIATLEQKLQEAEWQLSQARAEIHALKAERDSWNGRSFMVDIDCQRNQAKSLTGNAQAPLESGAEIFEVVGRDEEGLALGPTPQPPELLVSASSFHRQPTLQNSNIRVAASLLGNNASSSPPNIECACDVTHESRPYATYPDSVPPTPLFPFSAPPDHDAVTLIGHEPLSSNISTLEAYPEAPKDESTTLCSQAFVLIAQQNFRDLDESTIWSRLYKGFRRASRSDEGCRVDNVTLLALLDFVSDA